MTDRKSPRHKQTGERRLRVRKETLRRLGDQELTAVVGGGSKRGKDSRACLDWP